MVKEKKRKKNRTPKKRELQRKVFKVLTDNPAKSFNYKQISKILDIKKMSVKQLITVILYEMEARGEVTEIYTGKFKLITQQTFITGTIDRTSSGSAFLVTEEEGPDVFISEKNLNRAFNRDKVKATVYARKKGKKPEGEVVEIIERSRTEFVGTIQISQNFSFFIPDVRPVTQDFFIPKDKIKGAKNGQKVIVRIADWPEKAKSPLGEVIDILGDPGENETEMHAILAEYGLPYHYPERIIKAADKIPERIPSDEITRRKDFREITTFTIDPADAKDFDDALSIQTLDNGNIEVGVHIADVTHYVQPKTLLEKEAFSRATSVYLVDRVVPMLPERLSNHICSLRPEEEKLCFTVTFTFSPKLKLEKSWIGRTIIRSDKRFSYEEAQQVIETGEGSFCQELATLDQLAKKLRKDRFHKGAISFDRVEVKFNLDEKGHPLGVFFKESKDANKLIEEFMLLANRKVAEFIGDISSNGRKKPKTFVYRIHNHPDPEKFSSFKRFIKKFGYHLSTGTDEKIASSLNQVLSEVQGKKEQNMVETLAVRSMAKAEYSTQNIGHYGLAFNHYTHFTSPIRRYPDMMVHRLLARYLEGGRSANEDKYEEMCKHSSQMEQLAANAERASIKYKQVEFMKNQVGENFKGVISGVTEWGFYVELKENLCEGLVPMRDLEDDFYEFDQENYCIMGRKSKRSFRLGDEVTIKVAAANLDKKQLDFTLADI